MTIGSLTTQEKSPYVFISYSRRDTYDSHLASQIDEALRIRKVEVFRDQSSIEVGDVWPDELASALALATHFVVILSAESAGSKWVKFEIDAAVARPRDELRIIGIRRSTSAEFPQLAHIEVEPCDVGTEMETVFKAIGLPWLEDGRAPTSSRLRGSYPQSRLEAQLCDRQDVEDEFRGSYIQFLRAKPWTPQAHFIVGRDDEQAGSFMERLVWTYLEDEARALSRDKAAQRNDPTVYMHSIAWPPRWTVQHNYDALTASVFDAFFARYSRGKDADLGPATFARRIAELPPSVAVLVHTISQKAWNEQTPELLDKYLHFWREVGPCDESRLFFLFFNVQACHAQALDNESHCEKCDQAYVTIREMADGALCQGATGIPTTLLPLRCVRKEDVGEWFKDRSDALFAHFDSVCAKLFGSGDCQPMTSVERALRDVQIAILREAS